MLSRDGRVDRIGVWLETSEVEIPDRQASSVFRGMVWDRQGENVPAEWQQLSPQAPLPQELLAAGRSVELDHDALPMIGSLLELRHAVLVPVERRGRLRGVLLAGRRQKHGEIPLQLFESAAAELALTMELDEEHIFSIARSADLLIVKQFLADMSATREPDHVLADLVADCTAAGSPGELSAASIAVVGALRQARDLRDESNESRGPAAAADFLWKSGRQEWINKFENSPFAGVWRRALAERRLTVGDSETHVSDGALSASSRTFVHVVAVPFESDGHQTGILVVGFDHRAASPAFLERIELRASLAATVLAARARNQEETRLAAWRKSLLDNSTQATVLLDERGGITGVSVAACRLLGEQLPDDPHDLRPQDREIPGTPGDRFVPQLQQLFADSDQLRIGNWSARALSGAADRRGEPRHGPEELPEATLSNGVRVRLRPALPARRKIRRCHPGEMRRTTIAGD